MHPDMAGALRGDITIMRGTHLGIGTAGTGTGALHGHGVGAVPVGAGVLPGRGVGVPVGAGVVLYGARAGDIPVGVRHGVRHGLTIPDHPQGVDRSGYVTVIPVSATIH